MVRRWHNASVGCRSGMPSDKDGSFQGAGCRVSAVLSGRVPPQCLLANVPVTLLLLRNSLVPLQLLPVTVSDCGEMFEG